MTTTDTQPGSTPSPPDRVGAVAPTDLSGLLHAAQLLCAQHAELAVGDREFHTERRWRQLETIIDHVRRVTQTESAHYVVEKSTMIVDAALALELDARADTAVNSGQAQLLDEAGEEIEALVRRARPVMAALAADTLVADVARQLLERSQAQTRWAESIHALATEGSK